MKQTIQLSYGVRFPHEKTGGSTSSMVQAFSTTKNLLTYLNENALLITTSFNQSLGSNSDGRGHGYSYLTISGRVYCFEPDEPEKTIIKLSEPPDKGWAGHQVGIFGLDGRQSEYALVVIESFAEEDSVNQLIERLKPAIICDALASIDKRLEMKDKFEQYFVTSRYSRLPGYITSQLDSYPKLVSSHYSIMRDYTEYFIGPILKRARELSLDEVVKRAEEVILNAKNHRD